MRGNHSDAKNTEPGRARNRILLPATGVLAATVLLGLSAGGGEPTAGAAQVPQVATVRTLSGTHIYVKHGGRINALRKGGKVYLHDIVAIGPKTNATLRLTIPKNLKGNADLLGVYKQYASSTPKPNAVIKELAILLPYAKTHRSVKLKRTGKLIEVTVSE